MQYLDSVRYNFIKSKPESNFVWSLFTSGMLIRHQVGAEIVIPYTTV